MEFQSAWWRPRRSLAGAFGRPPRVRLLGTPEQSEIARSAVTRIRGCSVRAEPTCSPSCAHLSSLRRGQPAQAPHVARQVGDTQDLAHERETALADLLVDLFSESELRPMLASVGDRELLTALPSSSSPATLAHEAVAGLRRRGKIDGELFARLLELRPGRAADIATVRARWDDVLAVPPRLAETNDTPAPRTLSGAPAFLQPEARHTVGGLRLIDVRPGPLLTLLLVEVKNLS